MTTQPPPHIKLPIRCPRCAGTGYVCDYANVSLYASSAMTADLYALCRDCRGGGWVEARPGTMREASYDPLRSVL